MLRSFLQVRRQHTFPRKQQATFIERQVNRLRAKHPNANPATLIGSFLILHELTAFPPLLALFAIFQYSDLSVGRSIVDYCKSSQGTLGSWIQDSEEYIARVGKRKGWFGYIKASEAEEQVERVGDKALETTANAVAAYLLVKVLLPVRIGLCVWLAPPLASTVGLRFNPFFTRLGNRFMRRPLEEKL